jgi:dTDP-4-amino-4,6-dideoxygalactose transaminase
LGIGPGDEVIVPSFTFCSTANVVVHLGARPILVDVEEDCNISLTAIEKNVTPRTKAIMPVHHSGQASDLDTIYEIAARHNLAVVEDAAHAVGATYRDAKIGSARIFQSLRRGSGVRAAAVFSFYATKNMTTGEGGMITTDDEKLAEQMRLLTLHGMSRDAWKRYTSAGSWYYEVVAAGYKNNMTDIQAALGIHQLRRLDGFIQTRQRYAAMYNKAFQTFSEFEIPIMHDNRSHIYHLYVLRLNLARLKIDRAQFIEELGRRQIGTSVHFIPVHLQPLYAEQFGYRRGDLPRTEFLSDRIISLPLYPRMTPGDVHDVITAVTDVVQTFQRASAVGSG